MRQYENQCENHSERRLGETPQRAAGARLGASSGLIVLVCLLLVALGVVVWFLYGGRSRAGEAAAIEKLKSLGALVVVNTQTDRVSSVTLASIADESVMDEAVGVLADLPDLPTLDVSRTVFSDEHAKVVGGLTELTTLQMNKTKITDAALSELSGLSQLSSLGVANTAVTSKGLDALTGLEELSVVEISYTQVDGGLQALTALPKLNWLNMIGLKITDGSLEDLGESASLGKITLSEGTVSDDVLDALRKKKPRLIITVVSRDNGAQEDPPAEEAGAQTGEAASEDQDASDSSPDDPSQ